MLQVLLAPQTKVRKNECKEGDCGLINMVEEKQIYQKIIVYHYDLIIFLFAIRTKNPFLLAAPGKITRILKGNLHALVLSHLRKNPGTKFKFRTLSLILSEIGVNRT